MSATSARAEEAVRGKWGRLFARAGFVAKGVSFALVAFIALEVAFGRRGKIEDRPGALQELASKPFGRFLLAAVAVGLGAYAFWCFAQAILGEKLESEEDVTVLKRIGAVARALLYGWLCVMCTAVVFGADEKVNSGSGGGNEEDRATRIALEQPLGRYLVIAVGLAIVGAGAFNVYRAVTGDFRKELKEGQMGSNERRWYTWLGVVIAAAFSIFDRAE